MVMNSFIPTFFKSLFRTAVDGCILPGTTTGTEILWLYAKQWKSEMSTFSFALLSVLCSVFEPQADPQMMSEQRVNERESIQ
jgi:hypothetical protein